MPPAGERQAIGVAHNMGTFLEPPVGDKRTGMLVAVGGQYMAIPSNATIAQRLEKPKGLIALLARDIRSTTRHSWCALTRVLPATEHGPLPARAVERSLLMLPHAWSHRVYRWERSPKVIMSGAHPGCLECRREFASNGCEFDGKISIVRFRGRYHVYARANMKLDGGGRFVQAASTVASSDTLPKGEHLARSPYAPFARIRIGGYNASGPGNIYYAAVKPNPVDDQQQTLLGLFPVSLGRSGLTNGDGKAFMGLSISCDGFIWAPLHKLASCRSRLGRAVDHPVDGFLVRNCTVYTLIHRNVPGVSSSNRTSRLETYRMDTSMLSEMTRAAHATLPGCEQTRGSSSIPASQQPLPVAHVGCSSHMQPSR